MIGLDQMQLTFATFSHKSDQDDGNFYEVSSLGTLLSNSSAFIVGELGNFSKILRDRWVCFDSKNIM